MARYQFFSERIPNVKKMPFWGWIPLLSSEETKLSSSSVREHGPPSQTLGKGDAADWDSGTTDSRKRWEMLSDVSTVTTTTGAVMGWEQAQIRHRGSFLFSCLPCQVRNKAQNSKALSSIYIASGVCSWPNCYLWVLLLLFILTDSLFPYTWRWYLDQCCSLPAK